MSMIFRNPIFSFVGGLSEIYLGLFWMGLVEVPTIHSIFWTLAGALFLINGIISVLSVFKKHQYHESEDQVPCPEPSAEVLTMVRAGRKVAAIKEYRKQAGVGLKDAKEIIEKHSTCQSSTDT